MNQSDRLGFDVRKLKSFKTPQQFSNFHKAIGQDRFDAAWKEIEKIPHEAAAIVFASGFCDDWEIFTAMTKGYELDDAHPEAKRLFVRELRNRGLEEQAIALFNNRKEVV